MIGREIPTAIALALLGVEIVDGATAIRKLNRYEGHGVPVGERPPDRTVGGVGSGGARLEGVRHQMRQLTTSSSGLCTEEFTRCTADTDCLDCTIGHGVWLSSSVPVDEVQDR